MQWSPLVIRGSYSHRGTHVKEQADAGEVAARGRQVEGGGFGVRSGSVDVGTALMHWDHAG